MRNRLALAASCASLFAVLGGLAAAGWAVARVEPRTGLEAVPRASVAAVGVDVASIQAWAPARALATELLALPVVQREAVVARAGCGVDPLSVVDSLVLAVGRGSGASAPDDAELVVQGRLLPAPRLGRCVDVVLQQFGYAPLVPAPAIRGHAAQIVPRAGVAAADAPWVAYAPGAVVYAPPAAVARTLEVLDGRAPGADLNDRLRAAVGDVGGAVAWVAVDARAAFDANLRDATDVTNALAQIDPALGALLREPSLETAAAGVERTTAGLRLVASLRYGTDAEAQAAATQLGQIIDTSLAHGQLNAALTLAEAAFLARLGSAVATDPLLATRVFALQRAFGVLNGLPARVRVRPSGPTARVELELSAQDASALFDGAHAAAACEVVVEARANAAPGAATP